VSARKQQDDQVILDDPTAIKALAHPARLAVIDELYSGRELTATECAAMVGLSPSAMSYHLRALEKLGIVRRAESTGDGREHPWRAGGRSLTVATSAGGSRLARAASAALESSVIDGITREFADWLTRREGDDARWRDVGGVAVSRLWLTIEEAERIAEELRAVVARIPRRSAADHPAGSRRVALDRLMYPLDDGADGGAG